VLQEQKRGNNNSGVKKGFNHDLGLEVVGFSKGNHREGGRHSCRGKGEENYCWAED
jgi:hypothetical protein